MNLEDFKQILYNGEVELTLDEAQLDRVRANYEFLKQFSADKVIYGVNTGFGPMAQYIVPDQDRRSLQYNLIRSHASGMGEPLAPIQIKAVAMARLSSLMTARSGIHIDTVLLLRDMIQKEILPVIYAHGGVGASGDLVQLAHLALGMIGEGMVHYKGRLVPSMEALDAEGLTPMKVYIREGLALMNGTSAMTGIGMINILRANQLLAWTIRLSSMVNEIVETFDDHLSGLLNSAKWHKGQAWVAAEMRTLLDGSQCTKNRVEELYKQAINGDKLKNKLQEYYSIRCVPQILGPVYDALQNATHVLECEVNSSNDNPLVFDQEQEIFHGGNFHGDYISFEMDKIKMAITKLSMLSERQLNYLLNDRLNEKLPPFVNSGKLGFNFGLQGIQFTATSTVAENQTLSNPMYVHSIPCNNDNQDIVSMGANAALIASRVIENAFDVVAIETMAVVRSIAILDIVDRMAPATRKVYLEFEKYTNNLKEDRSLSVELHQIKKQLKELF
jgi:histidine ammonia-lyase